MGADTKVKVDFWVDAAGRVRDRNPWRDPNTSQIAIAEVEMLKSARRLAGVPIGCSDEIASSLGRGRVREFRETTVLPDGDGHKVVEKPYRSGCAAIQEDVFDRMTDQAKRRKSPPPFTLHQVDAGRAYRDLVERCQSAGIKVSSAFNAQAGGQGSTEFIDAYMADTQRLSWFHRAIGDGVAKDVVRGINPEKRRIQVGDADLARIGRKLITVRALVDAVCIHDKALSAVLSEHGWRVAGKNRITLKDSLCAALERMQGI